MKYLTFGGKDLMAGDEVCDLLIEYGAVLAQHAEADAVDIVAYNSTGDTVRAKLLLGEGTPLMAESAHSELPEPDNAAAIDYMRTQMHRWTLAPQPEALREPSSALGDEFPRP